MGHKEEVDGVPTWTGSPPPNIKATLAQKFWGHVTKAWHHMVKALVEMPPRDLYDVLGSSVWWASDIHIIGPSFSFSQAKDLYKKGFRVVDDIWDVEHDDFITWQEAQEKFGPQDNGKDSWNIITGPIMGVQHNILEKNGIRLDMAHGWGFFYG